MEFRYETIDPNNGELLKSFEYETKEQITAKLEKAAASFASYKKTSIEHRINIVRNIAKISLERKEEICKLLTTEMGKPIKSAREEVDYAISQIETILDNVKYLDDEIVEDSETHKKIIRYQPLGTLLTILPWNYPFWLVFMTTLSNMLAGNTIIVKHSPNTPQLAEFIEDIFREAGFDNNEYQNIQASVESASDMIAHDTIKGVSLTGSTRAGRAVASIAGRYLKKCTLELGGSDPFFVLEDVDVEKASTLACLARVANSGQICISPKRMLVRAEIYDEFVKQLISKIKNVKVGDPKLEETDMGPLARKDLLEQVKSQVKKGIEDGCNVLYGDKDQLEPGTEEGKGFFFTPMVIDQIPEDSAFFKEEVFGPVFALYKVDSDEEAIKIANSSEYGLGCAIISPDIERAEKICNEIDSGNTYVNQPTGIDLKLPYGGVKNSGYGREGREAIRDFTNVKTVVIKKTQ